MASSKFRRSEGFSNFSASSSSAATAAGNPSSSAATSLLSVESSTPSTPPHKRRGSAQHQHQQQQQRPGTPSSSSQQSGHNPGVGASTHGLPWDPVSYRGVDANIDDGSVQSLWPSDSDSSGVEDEVSVSGLKRAGTTAAASGSKSEGSTTTRFFRAILQKFGRSYNKKYDFLPNDPKEKDRNALQHQICLQVFGGRLHLAPISRPRRVLDLGTGPGNWVLDFANRHSYSAVIGVDLEPVKPEAAPPNCRFQVMDFNEKWAFPAAFDFIHLRMLGSLSGEHVIRSIYDNLNPGGWVEITEWILVIQSPKASFSNTEFYKWNKYVSTALKKVGNSVDYVVGYGPLLQRAGFTNVTERKYAVPTNAWAPGRSLQKLGQMMTTNWLTILDALTYPLFTGVLGWPASAVDALLKKVRRELEDPQIHSFMNLMTIYAQKPPVEPPASKDGPAGMAEPG
ncbi:S-adenosyl-L-methionine-dependent methyltransferase [Xylariaceae sp. FL0804]|nr:S-adenosyl-L-methionine-dependent methyltransferase [Xylariaceae sp. FL0804]